MLATAVAAFTLTPFLIERRLALVGQPFLAVALAARFFRAVNALNLIWALLASLCGVAAALLLRALRRVEEERTRELGLFSDRVAHELLTPLAPIADAGS